MIERLRAGSDSASRRPARVVTFSLGKIWYRWVDTVRGDRWSSRPISLFVSPRAARLAILACCGVSRSAVVPDGGPKFAQPGCPQLIAGAREPGCGAEIRERLPGNEQLGARFGDATTLVQLLAVQQSDAGGVEGPGVDVVRLQGGAKGDKRVAHAGDRFRRGDQEVHPG